MSDIRAVVLCLGVCLVPLTACSRSTAPEAGQSSQAPPAAAEAQPAGPPMAVGHGSMTGAPMTGGAPPVTEPIAPVAGGLTVEQVWADRSALAGKTVTVRGKVVKFNGGIMDRNWLHIQDGSGDAAEGTHDLAVTTSDAAKVGDVVTVRGIVAVDQDFTAGYVYKVMVEKADLLR